MTLALLTAGPGADDAGALEPGPLPDAAELYRQHAPRVLGWFRAEHVPDPEDLVGEVFLQVARDRHRFEGDGAGLRSWVFSIAYHRLLDDRKRRRRRPLESDRPVPDQGRRDPEPLDPELSEALGLLSGAQREVVVLRFVADLPLAEVARLTGRRVTAVKALQRRALRNLAEVVSPPA